MCTDAVPPLPPRNPYENDDGTHRGDFAAGPRAAARAGL